MLGKVLPAGLDAHYKKSGRKSVGIAGARRQDDRSQHILHGLAGRGVEDMRVRLSSQLKELLVIARGREGTVSKIDNVRRLLAGVGVAQANRPSPRSGRCAESVEATSTGRHQHPGDAIAAHDIYSPSNRVAFSNCPEIKLETLHTEADCALRSVQVHVSRTNAPQNLGNFGIRRNATFAAKEPPSLHQRAGGHVKSPSSRLTMIDRIHEQLKEFRLHTDAP